MIENNERYKKTNIPAFLFFFFIPVFIFIACFDYSEDKSALPGNVVAVVNQEKIYKDDFEWELEHFMSRYNISKVDSGKGERIPKDIVLEQLIRNKLFDQEIKRLSITVSVRELDDELRLITGEYTPDEFSKRLREKGIPFDKWKNKIRRNLLIKKLIEQEVLKRIPVNDREMWDYYQANQEVFSLPKRVEAYHIIVSDESEAHGIYEDLLSGVDFSEKAKQHSMGLESDSGGRMGMFSPGQLPEQFDKVIFNLKVGKFSDVIKTPYGYHIFKVIRIHKAKRMDFNDAKEKIKTIIVKEKESTTFAQWINKLKSKSKTIINENYFNQTGKGEKNV